MNKDDFPLLNNYKELVYLDNAATTQKPQFVIDTINEFYTKYNANIHRGMYTLSEIATEKYELARQKIAEFIGAKSEEIVFTAGTTDGINAIARSMEQTLSEGDTIITTELEHHSNFLPWQNLAKKLKLQLKFITVNKNNEFDIDQIKKLFTESQNVKIVAISGMSNVLGYLPPIKEIINLSHSVGAKVVIDGAQLIPHKKIDVKQLDIDYLVFSGHKIYGPTGIGVLYGKKELLDTLFPYNLGGGMITEVTRDRSEWKDSPEKFEAGTPNIEGAIALGAAIDYLGKVGFSNIELHEKNLTTFAVEKLSELPELDLYIPKDESSHLGVISLNIKTIHAHDTAEILNRHNIAVRAGHHCCQILTRDVLKVASTIRVSLGLYNDETDIEKLVEALKEAIMLFN